MSKQKVVAIVGPTCTGKTALSLAIGRRFPAEIIGCDSRNVYKYFDIGTAKPSAEEQAEIPHHLIDVAEPQEEFTAAEFARQASKAIEDISARKKVPIVCGGTGFYARALLEGLGIPDVGPQPELREQFKLLEENEKGSLYKKLAELDPITAARLNANDLFRVIRALEVCIVSGKAFSAQIKTAEPPYDVLWIGLNMKNRDNFRPLMKKRIAAQMAQGMLEEVRDLAERFGHKQKMMKTVNYNDLLRYLDSEISLEEAVQEAEKHNYQLARRQIMWFKTNPKINWFYVDESSKEKIEQEVIQLVESFVSQ